MRRRMYLPTGSPPSRSRAHTDRRQILKPALRLHEPVHTRRHGARIEVVRDKDQRRFLAHHLMQFGQQRETLFRVELAEDRLDQFVEIGIAVMAPVAALWGPL